MKTSTQLAVILWFGATTLACYAQGRRGLGGGGGFDSGDINAKPEAGATTTKTTVKTIEYVAVSPEREWKSADEKQTVITGSLLAFAREKETGRVSIVENHQVRLLVGKKEFTLPLAKLSAEDQAYIGKLVDSARAAGKLIESPTGDAEGGDSEAVEKLVE